MEAVWEFIGQYPGWIGAVVFVGTVAIFEWEMVKSKAKEFLFAREVEYRNTFKENKEAVINWIVENWYPTLPSIVRIVITKGVFRKGLENVYGEVIDWLEGLSDPG